MPENFLTLVSIAFILTTFATLLGIYYILRLSRDHKVRRYGTKALVGFGFWLGIQGYLTMHGYYNTNPASMPPKFILLVFPPLILIAGIFMTRRGRNMIDSLPLSGLTALHMVRIPVELVLYCLFLIQDVPELMTFAGRNFDILAGITAPFVAYYGAKKKKMGREWMLIWNFIALALLLNIVINAVFSAPFAFQKFALDQPNIAVLNFPFSWLPGFIVPAVLFCQLASIRKLIRAVPGTKK